MARSHGNVPHLSDCCGNNSDEGGKYWRLGGYVRVVLEKAWRGGGEGFQIPSSTLEMLASVSAPIADPLVLCLWGISRPVHRWPTYLSEVYQGSHSPSCCIGCLAIVVRQLHLFWQDKNNLDFILFFKGWCNPDSVFSSGSLEPQDCLSDPSYHPTNSHGLCGGCHGD